MVQQPLRNFKMKLKKTITCLFYTIAILVFATATTYAQLPVDAPPCDIDEANCPIDSWI